MTSQPLLVYYSSRSQNTHRFIHKLGLPAVRIPEHNPKTAVTLSTPQDLAPMNLALEVGAPYVLVVPTYAGHDGTGAVPKAVIHFLNNPNNRKWIRGVIASGNRNFGQFYAFAGDVIASRCKVPYLYRFELSGTDEDVINVKNGVEKLWKSWTQKQEPIAL